MTINLEPLKAASLLADAVSSVFADMAFIDAQESDETRITDSSLETKRAIIDVMTPLSCSIEMKITPAIRDRIVDTLFIDYQETERKKNAEDSLLEMLNIIAGSFLSSYFGHGTDIQLSLLRFLYFEETVPGQALCSLSFDAEGEPLELTLYSVRYRY